MRNSASRGRASATITYSVTVNDPLSGDGTLTNAVVGPPESNCDTGTETGEQVYGTDLVISKGELSYTKLRWNCGKAAQRRGQKP